MPKEPKGCEYCGRPGRKRIGPEDGAPEDVHACDHCWKLLQDPVTAVPLLRGHLSLEMRGEPDAAKVVGAFIDEVAGWRPRPRSS